MVAAAKAVAGNGNNPSASIAENHGTIDNNFWFFERFVIMDFIWTDNSPIAIHVSDEGYYPQLQSFANHYDLPVRYLPTNEDFYPQ